MIFQRTETETGSAIGIMRALYGREDPGTLTKINLRRSTRYLRASMAWVSGWADRLTCVNAATPSWAYSFDASKEPSCHRKNCCSTPI